MSYKKLLLLNIIYFLVVTLVLFYLIHIVWLQEQGFWVPLFLGSMNLAALSLMGLDKLLAKGLRRRVPELFFYIISVIGASTGVLIGALVFRHKTQKLRFIIILALILFAQIFAAAFLRQS